MVKNLKCDVLVIGAGPAGAVCASKLAKEGLEVICIDKGPSSGSVHSEKIDITESKGIEEIIKELKLDYLTKSNKSIWFSPNDKFTFVSKVHDLFFLRGKSKDSLDYSLFLSMKSSGVDVWFNSKIDDLDFLDKNCKSVRIIKDKSKVVISPKIIVVATGIDSFFHKKLKISELNTTKIVGFGALISNLRMEKETTNIFFDQIYAPGGYFFIGKVSNDIGIAMIVANKKKLDKSIQKYFYEFIEKNPEVYSIILGSKTLSFNAGERKISKVSKRVVGNIAFVGDSAGTLSSVFAYGVNPAIRSGYLLAESILKYGLDNYALIEYDKELKKILGNERQNNLMRKIYDNLSNADIDFLVETANYLHINQHLDYLVDSDEYKLRYLINAVLRKPLKSLRLIRKAIF